MKLRSVIACVVASIGALVISVFIGALTIRQHYINKGWYAHAAKIQKQDNIAVDASKKVEQKAEAKWKAEVEEAATGSLFPEWIRERAAEERNQKKGRKR